MNNLEIVQHAFNQSEQYAHAVDDCMVFDSGSNCVVVLFPYCTACGNQPNYLVSRNNERFLRFNTFAAAMDATANLLR